MHANPPDKIQNGSSFSDETFAGLSIDAADLTGKEFAGCVFRDCVLAQSRWARARLEDCSFENCDLSRIVPRGVTLLGVTFLNCKLIGVEWTDLGLVPDLTFDGCDLRYVSFTKLSLRSNRIVRCVARESHFVDVDLTETDFSDTDLNAATFQRCVLAKTNFTRASGLFFDPLANRSKGARVGIGAAILLAQSFGLEVED